MIPHKLNTSGVNTQSIQHSTESAFAVGFDMLTNLDLSYKELDLRIEKKFNLHTLRVLLQTSRSRM